MDGCYWSPEACAWVRLPVVDALRTPWSSTDLPVPGPPSGQVRDGWDVLGWFPPLPGLPQARRPAAPRVKDDVRT